MGVQVQSGKVATVPLTTIQPEQTQIRACGPKPKKKLVRRHTPDHSQRLRHGFQVVFLLMNIWMGGQFCLWVRQFEVAGSALSVGRPAGV